MNATGQVAIVRPSDHELMIEIQDYAAARGLILVTDGKDLAYTLPHAIPDGWTRFAMRDKNAGRLRPNEVKA